jgi:hypothetical protein
MFGKNNNNNNNNTIVNKLQTPLSSKTPTPTPSTANNSINLNDNYLYNDSNDPDCTGRSTKSINLCMNKRLSINDLTYLPKMSRKIDSFSIDDYPIFIIASQLTLIEWVRIVYLYIYSQRRNGLCFFT